MEIRDLGHSVEALVDGKHMLVGRLGQSQGDAPAPPESRNPDGLPPTRHHRPQRFDDWLDPDTPVEALLQLAQPPHPGPYAVRPVSVKVNNVRNEGPELLE